MDSAQTKEPAVCESPGEQPADAQQLPADGGEVGGATGPPSAEERVKDGGEDEQARRSQLSTAVDECSAPEATSTVATDDEDASDVSSSIADNENADSAALVVGGAATKVAAKPRKRTRQPAIMIGYKKRRKAQYSAPKKCEEEMADVEADTAANGVETAPLSDGEDKSESAGNRVEKSASEESAEGSAASTRSMRKYSSVSSEVTGADKFCWICHKEGSTMLKCIACPRVYHSKCHFQGGLPEGPSYDPSTFHCPECSAVLKADNVNTRSPVLVTVNLEQLCTLLQHIILILKSQKDSHYFWGPVDTKEFPHYREYVVYPMDLSVLEKNIKNEVYGCTEAFLADIKWIVHNSIVFNSSAAKITNVAKNLLKICKREIQEVETCAECYYNSLVRKDTWFIEVCKKPHLLVWARLKGYPPWPAKALKCKDGMVDCRFFGAHDKAWVPLKDCHLYSKIAPQPVKLKKGSHLESGIQELEKHIKKLKDKFGIFEYPAARIPYRPSQELEQLRMMLPNYNPNNSSRPSKYLIHPDRVSASIQAKSLFDDNEEKPVDEEEALPDSDDKQPEEADGEASLAEEVEKTSDSPPHADTAEDSSFESSSEAETSAPSAAPASVTPPPPPVIEAETPASPTHAVSEPPTSRKLVSVKNIDSINASVSPSSSPASSPAPETPSGDAPANEPKETSAVTPVASKLPAEVVTPEVVAPEVVTPKVVAPEVVTPKVVTPKVVAPEVVTPKVVTPKVVAPEVVTPKVVPEVVAPKVVIPAKVATPSPVVPETLVVTPVSDAPSSDVDFDLNKVKDEPIESPEPVAKDVDPVVVKLTETVVVSQPEILPPVIPPASLVARLKRPAELVDEPKPAKRLKPDAKCRTVNITENVTLSLINQSPPADLPKPRPPMARPKKPVSLPVPPIIPVTAAALAVANSSANTLSANRLVYGFSSPGDINLLRNKVTATPTLLPVTSTVVPLNRPNTKIQPRIVNHVSQTNGSLSISAKPAVTVTPSRSSPKFNESYGEFFNKTMNECLSECHSQFRRIFESTLEKLINKGDLRARIVALKKEMDVMKRNHERVMDEMRRDYEVQIAELRATSLAKSQFDLAAERVKLEQEKERAVKEAKSKQWCSNCQKIANYYCCWNTAYCDYECQKEHWIQHMHVCKNDVKKKAAESSENEPPRILMQSEISNGYPMNGYDRTGSSFSYGNVAAPIVPSHPMPRSGNFNRPRNKVPSQIRTSRPLLPRVTCTVSSTPTSNSPATNGAVAHAAFQNSRSGYSVASSVVKAVYSPLYQK